MSKELIVSATRNETRVAILEDDQLVEIFHQREQEYSLAGSIHKGRVTRVLPGMQSAFVDIGLERDAFLYVSDFFEDNEEYDKIVSGVEDKVLKLEKSPASASAAPMALPTPVEPEIAAVLGATPAPAPSNAPSPQGPRREPREAGSDPNRGGGDSRRGRGRRGRRRRPGQGGLPESKFFSPREGAPRETREPREARDPRESREPRPVAESSEVQAEPSGGLNVLPGESISKYVGTSPREDEEPDMSDQDIAAVVIAAERDAELDEGDDEIDEVSGAEFSESVEVSEEPLAEAESEVDPQMEAAALSEEADASTIVEVETVEVETVEVGFFESDSDPVESAEDDASEASVEREEYSFLQREPRSEPESAEATDSEVGASLGEGPEPARIPQSLTAALREQGNRLPHRMSRRMRRRMRGDRAPQEGEGNPEAKATAVEGQPTEAAPQAEVTAPAERRQGGGRGREERSRGERSRDERPREDRSREDRPREDRPREDRQREERAGDDRLRDDRSREEHAREERPRETREPRDESRPVAPSIADLLKSGQEIIVQIAKEPLGQKGARITSHIALPGRFLVYMPTVDHIGVSRKIPSDDERQRLKRILQTHRTGIPGGFIVRTAGDGRTEEELRADMMFLYTMWMDMRQKAEKKPAPLLLHHDLDVVERILRDQLTSAFKTVWVDNESVYESVLSFVQRFQPGMVGRIKLYTRPTPIFDEFGITQELEKALRPKVWLKSGGYIVINQTEALVAIDINTGKYVGKSNRLEDTIVKINTDAIKEIVRQIRLRDLGGIIVVDFIDMDERKNRQKVMQVLEESMRVDRAPYKILQFNDFGLVAITRKRVKQSLERTLCAPCPYCEGAGYVKSVATVISEILQEAHKIARAVDGDNVMLRVNPEVAKILKSNQNDHLEEIESIIGKPVMIKSDPLLHQTKFDLA